MSNTRHVDLAKLAAVMRGQLPAGVRPVPPQIRERSRISFPRIPAERFEELLDEAFSGATDILGLPPGGITAAEREALLAYATGPVPFALHYQGRPQ